MSGAAKIDVEGLDVVFGRGAQEVHAVRNLSFTVAATESFGIVGESGSGKSTVLRAICGLAPVTAGRVLIDGAELRGRRDRAFAGKVQMVFQDPYASLHPRHTIDRVLSEPLAIHGFSGREERVSQALVDVGLGPEFRFRFPHQLSGGQRQRVATRSARAPSPARAGGREAGSASKDARRERKATRSTAARFRGRRPDPARRRRATCRW